LSHEYEVERGVGGEDGIAIACYYSRVVVIFVVDSEIHTLERVAEPSDGGLNASGSRITSHINADQCFTHSYIETSLEKTR
jgi:hypothetical protein